MEIVGREASLSIVNPFKPGRRENLLLSHGDRVEKVPVRGQPLYLGEVEDMEEAILDQKPPRISLAHSRANVAAITSLVRSAREGRVVGGG
jgi:predicted dehydrogenase